MIARTWRGRVRRDLLEEYPEDDEFLVDRESTVSHFEAVPGWTAPAA